MDFTITTYLSLLDALQKAGYRFITFREYMIKKKDLIPHPETTNHEPQTTNHKQQTTNNEPQTTNNKPQTTNQQQRTTNHKPQTTNLKPQNSNHELQTSNHELQTTNYEPETLTAKLVILRHDVDALPRNSLRFARIQSERGIRGTYYFRAVQKSFNREIIREIAGFGHEIGYHYENMDTCRGNTSEAYTDFCRNLDEMRTVAPVETICMHGSPLSRYDNRELWKHYNYRSLGIIGEPYLDIDFNEVAYFTDTGRRWNGHQYSIRDKVEGNWPLAFRKTDEIIENIEQLPAKIMFTFHPQRWTNNPALWMKELLWQNVKNTVKRVIVTTN